MVQTALTLQQAAHVARPVGVEVTAPGEIMAERCMWCKTTVSGNAAAQAAEVLVALEDESNIDADAEV